MKSIKESIIGRRGTIRKLPELQEGCSGTFGRITTGSNQFSYVFNVDFSKNYNYMDCIELWIELRNLLRIDLPGVHNPARALSDFGESVGLNMYSTDIPIYLATKTGRNGRGRSENEKILPGLDNYRGMESPMRQLIMSNSGIPGGKYTYKDIDIQFNFSKTTKKLISIDINIYL